MSAVLIHNTKVHVMLVQIGPPRNGAFKVLKIVLVVVAFGAAQILLQMLLPQPQQIMEQRVKLRVTAVHFHQTTLADPA